MTLVRRGTIYDSFTDLDLQRENANSKKSLGKSLEILNIRVFQSVLFKKFKTATVLIGAIFLRNLRQVSAHFCLYE